jgi:hypothetical protein
MPIHPRHNYSKAVERMARTMWTRERCQQRMSDLVDRLPDGLAEIAIEVAEELEWPRFADLAEDALVALMNPPPEVVDALEFADRDGFGAAGKWQLAIQAALYGDNVRRDQHPEEDDPNPFADSL